MPTYGKFAPFCMSRNKPGLVGINRNNPCDGYFGCDNEEIFQDDEKALLKTSSKNAGKQHSHLPWARRKSPPVLSFFKRVASLKKHPETSKQKDARNANRCGYRTLPTPKRRDLNVPGYTCFPFDSGFTSLKRNYCCDGYFGCPPVNKN